MAVNMFRGLGRFVPRAAKGRTGFACCRVQALEPRQLLTVGIAIDGDPDPDPGPGPDPSAGPAILSLAAAPEPVRTGSPLTLTASGVRGRAVTVSFYAESNGLPGLQGPDDPGLPQDRLIGTDGTLTGGYTTTVSTTGMAAGAYTYYAQAEGTIGVIPDTERVTSNVVTTTSTVLPVVRMTGLQASSTTVLPPATIHLTPIGLSDPNNDVAYVEFRYRRPNGDSVILENSHSSTGFAIDLDVRDMEVGTAVITASAVNRDGSGAGSASTSFTVLNAPPQLIQFELAHANPYLYFEPVSIHAAAEDANGFGDTHIDIYRESNGTPGLQTGAGGDLLAQDGAYNVSQQELRQNVGAGTYTYYAFAEDKSGARSAVQSLEAVMLPNRPPTIDSLLAGLRGTPGGPMPITVAPGATVTLTAVNAVDPDQTIIGIGFWRETNGVPGLQFGSDALLPSSNPLAPSIDVQMPMAGGTYTFYAMADDADGGRSVPLSGDVIVPNYVPTIPTFWASPDNVAIGGTVTLNTSGVADGNGPADLRGVSFYHESNGVPGLQVGGDTGLGLDATAADGYSLTVPWSILSGGTNTYYATAVDTAGAVSAVAVARNVVQAPPTIRALIDSPDPVRPGGTIALTADGVSDPNGDAVTVWFYRESNGIAGLQPDDALLGPAGAAGGYTLNVTAPTITGAGPAQFTYYAVGDDGAARGSVVSTDNTVSDAFPSTRVEQVFVNGQGLTGGTAVNQVAFRALAGVDNAYGYPVPAGANQVRSIPWYNGVNRVALRFNVPAEIEQGDLVIRDAAGATRAVRAFAYDPATRTAVWTLETPVVNDRLRLTLAAAGISGLDGEWQNSSPGQSYPSGDGRVGGDFDFRVSILGGDATGDGRVNALDLASIKQRLARSATSPGSGSAAYSGFADLNADGQINALDVAVAKQRLNRVLPTAIL